jgi:Ca-activated chloride channel homolog
MARKYFVSALIILSLVASVSAQSGRKVLQPSTVPSSTPQVQQTQDMAQKTDEVGYSESSPNASRPILPGLRNTKKPKKELKAPQPSATPKTDIATVATADDDEVIKVGTSLITIPVSVYDRNGLYIPNLSKDNFKIFEDGKEQEVAYFGVSEKPFTVILLIDVSPSTAYKIEEIQDAAASFVKQLKPQDLVMVIEFDSSVHVLSELTNDREKIFKAIGKANFGDGTSLYDAVDFSLRKRLDKIEGRKAIVLFTDGVDTFSSRASYESTVEEAEESEAMIFPIYYNTFLNSRGIGSGGVMSSTPILGIPQMGGGMSSAGTTSEDYTRGRIYLTQLAAATGGRVFRPESTPGGLTVAFEGIAEELRRQYNIGYYPENEGQAGDRKQIKVRVNRPKLVIRSRDSYIVGAGSQNQSSN